MSTPEKPSLSRLEKLAGLNLVFVALVYILCRWVAEATSLTTFIAYLPPIVWTLPTLFLLVFCLRTKRRKKAMISWSFAALLGLILTGFSIPSTFSEVEGRKFTLMTFNVHHGEFGRDEIIRLVHQKEPDIVCFQEADNKSHFGPALPDIPGYFMERRRGLAIAAKEPVTEVREVTLSPGARMALEAKVGEIKVVNVQLTSFKRLTSPGHFKEIADVHRDQVRTLIDRYSEVPDCMIVGDFNTPPAGHNYRNMSRKFEDAFASKGWGFGYTYPSRFPLLRIDYAFLTSIKPLSAEVVATTASDHRPVFFELLLYRPT